MFPLIFLFFPFFSLRQFTGFHRYSSFSIHDRRLYRVIELNNCLVALLVHYPQIYPDGLPEGSHLIDKAKTEGGTEDDGEGGTEDDGEDEDDYEDDDGNGDEDGDDKEEEELTMRNRLNRRSFRAALCVGFDSFSDPPEAQGLAHFLEVLGGAFPLGSLVMVIEDAEEPHHMYLLRNFMAQGLVHGQPLLYASPAKDPRGFLGTLPSPIVSKDEKSREPDPNHEKGLRIDWQYKKYFSENHLTFDGQRVTYLKNALFLISVHAIFFSKVQVVSLYVNMVQMENSFLFFGNLVEMMATFLVLVVSLSNHFVLHSVCIPAWSGICLTTIISLKSMVQSSNSVAIITFPPSLLSSSFCKRWHHMEDTFLLVKAIQDEDKKLALLLTGYQDIVGFLNVHKLARINTQVRKH
ncbi:hypothetical protein F3Y22_tig00000477pilonHSYRG00483 [Hibiscus syriacus]|uniref:Elongator complex protein 4 n=1 Tax=Hibiscus syriacus TaxID=106335 RepID=A0A6A3D0K5_HIBSY|nr:hypothetical protein F3Y22_tig00000477pilonHSYRG00483 [Hibiscus syriacus]